MPVYTNGRVPATQRFDVGLNGEQLPAWARTVWDRIDAAARRRGWDIRSWITDRTVTGIPACYRSFPAQQFAAAVNPPPKSATPGYSNHGGVQPGSGVLTAAIDFGRATREQRSWLRLQGLTFPLAWEPWHAEFPTITPADYASTVIEPIPAPVIVPEEGLMYVFRDTTKQWWLVNPTGWVIEKIEPATASALASIGVTKTIGVNVKTVTQIQKAFASLAGRVG